MSLSPTSLFSISVVSQKCSQSITPLFRRPHRDPTLSDFEQLPTEIVQVIFEHSNNISLPLSSIIFARLLSAEKIYIRFTADLIYAANCDADLANTSNTAAAVSRMLQCKWMTWKIFTAAVIKCFGRAKEVALASRAYNTDDEEEEEDQAPLPPTPRFERPDEQQATPSYLYLDSKTQLPEKLLRGPWSADKTAFLYYLTWNDVGIDWSLSSRGEVAIQGLQHAIEERNRKAVAALVSPTVGVVPSIALVKSAVMDHGCDPTTVFHLLQATLRALITQRAEGGQPMTDFSFRDPSLWSWASRVKASGNEKGEWLTTVLRFGEDARLANSSYDEATHDDFVRVCGQEEDGVRLVKVPLNFSANTRVEQNEEEEEGG